MRGKNSNLELHAHEHPLLAGNIQVVRPVIQGGHFETNPLQALGQLERLVRGHAAVDASDDVAAAQGTVAKLNESHETVNGQY